MRGIYVCVYFLGLVEEGGEGGGGEVERATVIERYGINCFTEYYFLLLSQIS